MAAGAVFMLKRVPFLLALSLLALGCDTLPLPGKQQASAGSGQPAAAALPPAVQEGKALMDKGQLDEALAKLAELPDDPISLYYQGIIYVRKGMGAPLPETGFRPDDKNAAVLLERAIAAKPEFAAAHFTLAEVLAPYTLQRHAPGKRRPPRQPSPAPDDPDISPERVARAYQAAVQYDKTSRAPIDALIKFAREMKRPADADMAYREVLQRDKESAEPHLAYGDFLANEKKDRLKAIEQYQLALVWKPQDPTPQDRSCDVYIAWAQEHFDKSEWASADARLKDAQKFVTGLATPQALRIKELQGKLAAIRR